MTTLPALTPTYVVVVCALLPPATPQPQHVSDPAHGPQPMQQPNTPLPPGEICTSRLPGPPETVHAWPAAPTRFILIVGVTAQQAAVEVAVAVCEAVAVAVADGERSALGEPEGVREDESDAGLLTARDEGVGELEMLLVAEVVGV